MKTKFFVPDRYMNFIRFRVPRRIDIRITSPIEEHFTTWREAHECLLERRKNDVVKAHKDLVSAEKRYKFANNMREPNNA